MTITKKKKNFIRFWLDLELLSEGLPVDNKNRNQKKLLSKNKIHNLLTKIDSEFSNIKNSSILTY